MTVYALITFTTFFLSVHSPFEGNLAAGQPLPHEGGISGDESNPPPNSTTAQCLLKISWDENMLPSVDQQLLDELILSSAVSGAAKREVLGDDGQAEVIPYRIWPGDGQPSNAHVVSVAVRISGLPDDGEPRAQRYLDEICKRLKAALGEFADDHVRDLHARLAFTEKEAALAQETVSRLNALQIELCDEADHADLRRDMLFISIGQLQAQRRDLELERVAREARRTALERQLAENATRIKEAAKKDSTLLELGKVVEIRTQQLARIEQLSAAKSASDAEVAACREQLAQAQFQLAQQRQMVAARLGGEQMAELNSELTKLTIDDAEAEARLQFISTELEKTKALLSVADRYESEINLPLPMARDALESSLRDQNKLKRILATFQKPVVRLIGADEKSEKE